MTRIPMEQTAEQALSASVSDFWVSSVVPVLEKPNACTFLREGVSAYQPVVIRGMIDDWPATRAWNLETLCNKLGGTEGGSISVTMTPDGKADCPIDGEDGRRFAYPFECNISPSLFKSMLENPEKHDAVPYLSVQNDNLRKDMPMLLNDIPPSLSIAKEAFGLEGESPEAINLWVGDERSTSSCHKDHYENLYCVIYGCKTFTLLPPTDIAFLTETEFPTCRYRYVGKSDEIATINTPTGGDRSVEIDPENTTSTTNQTNHRVTITERVKQQHLQLTSHECPSESISWIDSDPDNPLDLLKHPNLQYTHPIHVTVHAGEVLYIPALWYHQVSQTCVTIAVNYWYDMKFDFRWVLYQHVRRTKTKTSTSDNTESHSPIISTSTASDSYIRHLLRDNNRQAND